MSWAIWITGIPGSGKSALARAAAAELAARGYPVRVLELDAIRKTLTPEPRYTDEERDVVYRALGWMARLLTEARVPVIVDATAHRRVWRDLARSAIPRFAEVQVVCPPELARERERTRTEGNAPAGIYQAAGRPGATVPGVDVPYEPAIDPELTVDSARESVADAADRIAQLGAALADAVEERITGTGGWAIWVTGRPGSGKTTMTRRVLEALARHPAPVRVLDLNEVRDFLVPDRRPSEADLDILHRALAYAAKLLTEVGVAVIVDATAPRRAWRQTARALIPCFAEIQLLCPEAVCLERERAARWGLTTESGGAPQPPRPARAPDVVIDYEESFRPELVVRTDMNDPWTAAQEILLLVQRLSRAPARSFESQWSGRGGAA